MILNCYIQIPLPYINLMDDYEDYDDSSDHYHDSEPSRFTFCISFKGIKSLEQMLQNINSGEISFNEFWMRLGLLANETPVIIYDFWEAFTSGMLDVDPDEMNEEYCFRRIDALENSDYEATDEVVRSLNLREARVLVDPEKVKRLDKINEEIWRNFFD